MSSNQASTPARPFAPDDFKRKRPANLMPPTSSHIKPAIRSPMISPQTVLQTQSQTSSITDDNYSSVDSRASSRASNGRSGGGGSLDNRNGVSKAIPRGITGTGKSLQLKEWQDLADKEWQSMKDRRRSDGQRSSSPLLHSSLTKQALMVKSNSAQTMSALATKLSQQQQSERSSNDLTQGPSDDSSLQFTTRSSWDSAAPASTILASRNSKSSKIKGQHRGSTPISDSEYDRYSVDKRASIEAGAHSIISSTSSRFSFGGDSTRDLLSRADGQRDTYNHREEMLKGRSRRAKSLFSSNQLTVDANQIETTNVLSSEEKTDQMKRSNKLADMLGEEWRQQRAGQDSIKQQCQGGISSSSPLKDIVARRAQYKQRRQSEPLQAPFLADVFSSSKERHRSSSDAYMLEPVRPSSKKGVVMTPSSTIVPPLTPLPLGVHPKAAAILGLCVLPSGASPIAYHQRIEEQITPGQPTSSSSVEMLKDSESLFSMDQTYAEIQRSRVQAYSSDNAKEEEEKEDDDDDEEDDEEAALNREERRRRVRKISRWLGAAVPPHLVQPFPNNLLQRQTIGSGYNQDEAPPLPMTDYMSGTPLHQLEKRRVSPDGTSWNSTGASSLIKAKAVVNAKLHRKNYPDYIKEGQQYSSSEGTENTWMQNGSIPMMTTKTITLNSEEHKTSVKRNHKLTAVFGEAPPVSMLSEKSPTSPNRKNTFGSSNTASHRVATQDSHPNNLNASLHTPSAESFNDNQSMDSSFDSRRASSQYRLSIESLEYLLRKNPPLLKDLVSALEEEDDDGDEMESYKTTSGGSCTPTESKDDTTIECSGMIINRNPSQESITESSMNVEISQLNIYSNESLQADRKKTSNIAEKLENRKRELKVKRHQKLGRWFGELPPQEGETIRRDDDGILIGSQTIEIVDEGPQSRGKVMLHPHRMAPRSAGSAIKRRAPYPRQFSLDDVLTSIEGEVKDDEHLQSWEKKELQDRLRQLRSDTEHVW